MRSSCRRPAPFWPRRRRTEDRALPYWPSAGSSAAQRRIVAARPPPNVIAMRCAAPRRGNEVELQGRGVELQGKEDEPGEGKGTPGEATFVRESSLFKELHANPTSPVRSTGPLGPRRPEGNSPSAIPSFGPPGVSTQGGARLKHRDENPDTRGSPPGLPFKEQIANSTSLVKTFRRRNFPPQSIGEGVARARQREDTPSPMIEFSQRAAPASRKRAALPGHPTNSKIPAATKRAIDRT